ncbi:MAG: BamA/TamA family outer membrane protein [Acetobacter sp.]|nr:BamA/TamA family outer membrane protein [Acetobacter sp.]
MRTVSEQKTYRPLVEACKRIVVAASDGWDPVIFLRRRSLCGKVKPYAGLTGVVAAALCFGILLPCGELKAASSKKQKPPVDSYTTDLASTGDAELDSALKGSSDLISLQKTPITSPFALSGRVRSDYERLETALGSFGYYSGKVNISLKRTGGSPNADPALPLEMDGNNISLPNWLAELPHNEHLSVHISVNKGPLYHIGTITIIDPGGKPLQLNAAQQKAFGLKEGMPAIASDVLAGSSNLTEELQKEGHPLAEVQKPIAYLKPETKTLDLKVAAKIGPRADIGPISLDGLKRTKPAFIRRRLQVKSGMLYNPDEIEDARQDLASLGIFSTVNVSHPDKLDADGTIPLKFAFTQAKLRSVSAEGGYSSDLGGRAGASWTHNNLLGAAERLKLTALVTGLGGSAQQGLGYDVYADFMKPNFPLLRQTFNARIEGLKQHLYSYNQTAILARAGMSQRLSKRWNLSYALQGIQERIKQMGDSSSYLIISLPVSENYDSTDVESPLLPATHGVRLSLSVTPAESLESGSTFYMIFQGNASTYFDLSHLHISKPGNSVIAIRGVMGSIQGAGGFALPPDQRLYAGGSATVRGFRYQGVGPQFAGTKYAIGGTAMDAGTVELRQRVYKNFGFAGFVDAGQVATSGMPFEGKLRVGVGGGVRYYTPIGPIRVDMAVPMNRPYDGDKWELYIGLGETF